MNQNNIKSNPYFVPVYDTNMLIPILENRLPKSANIYNMAKAFDRFPEEMKFFTLSSADDDVENVWIIATYLREDYGMDVNISTPENAQFTQEIKQAFEIYAPFSWDKPYCISMVDRNLSKHFYELSVNIKGNLTIIMPCYFNYINREDALNLNISHPLSEEMEIKPLEIGQGTDFLYKNWKYSKPASKDYLQKLIARNESAGVYNLKNNEPISGIVVTGSGFMGFLYTSLDYRNKGIGSLAIKFLMKDLAQKGFIPCASAEINNSQGLHLQNKVGLKTSHIADYIALHHV